MKWTLFDYGVGNLHSLRKALQQHVDVEVAADAARLADADAIVLPGVGAFGPVMQALAPAAEDLRAHHAAGRPLIGVCIGMQALYEGSQEAPGVAGLGILPGVVYRLDAAAGKIPHMGWNTLEVAERHEGAAPGNPSHSPGRAAPDPAPPDPVTAALAGAGHVYYVHSYAAPPGPGTLATTTYGTPFAAAVRQGSAIAFQFHPEKSSAAGKAILGAALRSLEDA